MDLRGAPERIASPNGAPVVIEASDEYPSGAPKKSDGPCKLSTVEPGGGGGAGGAGAGAGGAGAGAGGGVGGVGDGGGDGLKLIR
eukprot:COSAG06_NODE_65_length_26676_cov_11.671107_7_plen_85_part_00